MLGNNDFDTIFAKSLITDCNIFVVANEGGALLDKAHISSFTMTRENECAVSFAPNDTAVLEIINWNTLSADAKYIFSKPTSYGFQNFVWLFFVADNEQTNYGICFAVEKVEVNTKKWRAKITLCSPFRTKIRPVWGDFSLDTYGFDAMPSDVTAFEELQHIAVNTGRGLIIPNYQDYYWNDYDFVDDINRGQVDVTFNKKNILGDIVESEDDNDRSEITFVGIANKTGEELFSETKQPTLTSGVPTLNFTLSYGNKSFIITEAKVYITHSGSDVTNLFTISKYSTRISLYCRSSSLSTGVNYQCIIKGYEVELAKPTTDTYVKSYTWLEGSAGLLETQAKTREYYSHKKYIEFDCRLDPRIEPLDNIFIDNLGVIKIEKVTMTFNGAFKGRLKGRLIQDMTLKAPVITDVGWYPQVDPNSFHFNVKNDNPVTAVVRIVASDGTYEYDFTIQPYTMITITQVNAPNLMSSFMEKADGNLGDDVYCFLYVPTHEWGQSDSSIILEADW